MLWDTHLHTRFSGDSQADPAAMIAAARDAGLAGICFTDHLDLDFPGQADTFLLDAEDYFHTIPAYGRDSAQAFPVLTGIELGLQPHLAGTLTEFVDRHPLDFVIGSSHVVHGLDPYYGSFFEGKEEHVAYREYFESILENIRCFGHFDVYGHIDYVVRYGPNKNRDYTYEAYRDVIDEVLMALIQRGKGIELNTGGFKYGLGHPNPTEAVIKRYRQLGGEIITIGSDAHEPGHIAYDFHKVTDLLKDAGFSYFTVFRERKPQFYRL